MGNKNSSLKIIPTETENKKDKYILGIIDPQNDFFFEGSLAVNDANSIIGPINKLRFMLYEHMNTFISQDFHPPNHMSFASTYSEKPFTVKNLTIKIKGDTLNIDQTLWPNHCVQNTNGANINKNLILLKQDKIFKKGTLVNIESYSAFGDEFNAKYENTYLNSYLISLDIKHIILVGLATDYCVYNTAKDAVKYGYSVHIIRSCTRGVAEDTTKKAIDDLITKGVEFYNDVDDFVTLNKHNFY